MNRSLKDIFAIVKDLQAVYAAYQKDAADGKISAEEALALAEQVLAVLVKHNVTIAELQELLADVAPLLPLLR